MPFKRHNCERCGIALLSKGKPVRCERCAAVVADDRRHADRTSRAIASITIGIDDLKSFIKEKLNGRGT
jgi:tRNA(Ile2) C34 agmatinyltransferase TiaS